MGCKEDCSIAVIFQELLITQTWNKCHWIWHALNPKYMPLKPFQCIFPSQKQQNVKFLPDFYSSGTTYHRDSKPMPLDLAHLKPYIHATQAISMHFSLSKSTKCEIYASLLNSSKHKMKKTSIWTGKKYFKRLENLHREVSGMPITMHYISQNQQNVKFMPVYWTPPNTKWKKTSIWTGKKCSKRLENLHRQVFRMPITMHYIRTLCDKYFFSYEGFSEFLTRRFRHRVLKHGVWVEWDARRTAA